MRYLTFVLLLTCFQLTSQTTQGLVTWISFDKPGCIIADEMGDPGINVFPNGELTCACGVKGNSLRFDGDDDWFYILGGDVSDALTSVDFTLSFYFKSLNASAQSVALFTKRENCSTDSSFAIRFNPAFNAINVELSENPSLNGSLSANLPFSCWSHIAVVRKGSTTILYVNGEEAASVNAPGAQRVDVRNNLPLTVGDSECNADAYFDGFMDEIRLYNRSLKREEIRALYFQPDQIRNGLVSNGTKDTIIFLGNSVQTLTTNTCATSFQWSPTTGVSDPTLPTPLITPTDTTTYTLEFDDNLGCRITDSLRIFVIDPSTIDCRDIKLPSAFTPNNDGLNETFGISNPFVAGEILSFDIFDRWGNIVFFTTDHFGRWDGNYKDRPVNPGVFLYRINFRCKGVEGVKTGSVTVIR